MKIDCEKVVNFPSSILNLSYLKYLGISVLHHSEIPKQVDSLKSLKKVNLFRTGIPKKKKKQTGHKNLDKWLAK